MAAHQNTPEQSPKPFYRRRASKADPLKRSAVVTLRLTDMENDLVTQKADECGLTKSELLRQLALGFEPKARLTDEQLALLQDVRKVRYDLQQMSNFFSREDSDTWRTTLYYLNKAIAKLKPLLKL